MDVEPDLPPMEEMIIWLDMTGYQRMYYKALYTKSLSALLSRDNCRMPALRNTYMQLRMLLCHPVRHLRQSSNSSTCRTAKLSQQVSKHNPRKRRQSADHVCFVVYMWSVALHESGATAYSQSTVCTHEKPTLHSSLCDFCMCVSMILDGPQTWLIMKWAHNITLEWLLGQ